MESERGTRGLHVAVFGATGMVGRAALRACLAADDVARVVAVGRRPCGERHARLEELVPADLFDLAPHAERLAGLDACIWAIGTSAALGADEAPYTRITHDLPVAAGRTLLAASPGLRLAFVSAHGADPRARAMWARVKGRAEDSLRTLPFAGVHVFRPFLIQPERGLRSSTPLYDVVYTCLRPVAPLLLRVAPGTITTTARLAQALLAAACGDVTAPLLDTRAINALAAR